MANLPSTAIWNAADLYIQGMRMTYVNGTTFTVNQGAARDSTNLNDIGLYLPPQSNGVPITTPFTLNSAINGAGGLDKGVIAAQAMYYVFVIGSSNNSTINLPPSPLQSQVVPPFASPSPTSPVVQDGYYVQTNVMISLSMTAPTLPFGYDMFRRIGAVSTSGSAFRQFVQTGYGQNRTMWYDGAVIVANTGSVAAAAYTSIDLASPGRLPSVLPATALTALLTVTVTPAAAGSLVSFQPFGGVGLYASLSGVVAAQAQVAQLQCPTGLNAGVPQINYQTTGGAVSLFALIQGYIDQL